MNTASGTKPESLQEESVFCAIIFFALSVASVLKVSSQEHQVVLCNRKWMPDTRPGIQRPKIAEKQQPPSYRARRPETPSLP